jgi:hypothetical protein
LGTKEKREKFSPPSPTTQNLKERKKKALWVHAEPSHWLHEISISKTVCDNFWPGLIPPLQLFTSPIYWMRCVPSSITFFLFFFWGNKPIWLVHNSKRKWNYGGSSFWAWTNSPCKEHPPYLLGDFHY